MSDNPTPLPVKPAQPAFDFGRGMLNLALIMALLGITAFLFLSFMVVWMVAPAYGGHDLTRYAPLKDGGAQLIIQLDQNGEVLTFSSQNVEQTYRDTLLMGNTDNLYQSLHSYVLRPTETNLSPEDVRKRLAKTGLFEINIRNLALAGAVQQTSNLVLRSQSGDHLAAEWGPDGSASAVYAPPILLHPADMSPGEQWEGSGRASTGQNYQVKGYIKGIEEHLDPLGRTFKDCLQINLEITFQAANGENQKKMRKEWLCPGIGLVHAEEITNDGPVFRFLVVRSTRQLLEPEGLQEIMAMIPPLPTLSDTDIPDLSDSLPATEWQLSLVGEGEQDMAQGFYENTFSPTWLPTDPPMLLTAQASSSMIARDAASPMGPAFWEYNTGSQIYKEPVFDAKRGHIYFGSADELLISLDGRGLFLWAFQTSGNAASRPVIVDDLVIFGCEDRTIYALNADTGHLVWKNTTGGPIVSSPTLANDLVVIGSDDGLVYAFETQTGAARWTFKTNRAIEAPIVNTQGQLLIASRDGNLYAVDAASGASLWKASTGAPLRTAPLLADGMAVVASDGDLFSFEQTTGKKLWTNADHYYQGPLLLAGETILAASDDGQILFLSLQGIEVAPALSVQSQVSDATSFSLGLTQGGENIWLGDNWGRIWRISSH